MADIVISIGEKVVERLVDPIIDPILDRARYFFCFKHFIKDLEGAKNELKRRLDEVKERKEQVEQNSEEIMLPVKKWLKDVEKILEEVQELQQMVEREGKSCFNVSHRYSLAQKMDTKAKQMKKLKVESHFDKDNFSRRTQIPGIASFSSKDFVDFSSRKSTSKHLSEAVKDVKNKMIGLYGMGGSGKTTLAKEVGKEVHDLKIFEKVVFAVVSKPPNVVKLQQEIAEQINFKFQLDETQLARAQRLTERLRNMKILIILDDVWEYLCLEDIGIPLVEGCHILLTTRLRNVCLSMDCEPIIELPLINNEEAWELFKKYANLNNDPLNNKFHDVGRNIVDECKGLPIAIVVVGSSLKGKPIAVWQSSLKKLKTFQPLNVEPGFKSPYACLELSYDSLPSPRVKSLFLLCSMFPEDHEIHKEDLFRFGKSTLELEENMNVMEDARREILAACSILLDSCLLMSTNNQACIKMHDLVRDVALWIANKQRQAILVDRASNMLVSNRGSLNDIKALSLWNLDENFKLSNQLCCPTLDILLLQPYGNIEDFQGIKALKVLALIAYGFTWKLWRKDIIDSSIPQSIGSLTNLHTLCLRRKKLGDISFLGELKGLEVLDLRGSQFNELPLGIVDMKMLKLLDLFGCEIEKSPLDVIQRCEQLEELYLWDNKSIILENFSLLRLERYIICDSRVLMTTYYHDYNVVSNCLEKLDSYESMRALCIQGFTVSTLASPMKDLIHRANFLRLDNSMWDPVHINLFEIKHLWISNCQDKRFIIDSSVGVDDILQTQAFSQLITLRLDGCSKVKWLFSFYLASHCHSLEIIGIYRCDEFERFVDEEATNEIQDYPNQPLIIFPKLKEIEMGFCNEVRLLLPYSVASHCHSLEKIEIYCCDELERLVGGNNNEEVAYDGYKLESLLHKQQPLINFPKLKKIKITDCDEVRLLLPYSVASHCPSLEKIDIYSCSKLKRLVGGNNDEEVPYGNQPLLKLKELDLLNLPKLGEVFRYYKLESLLHKQENPQHEHKNERVVGVVNSELEDIYLWDLPKLNYIFKGPAQIVSLYNLKRVYLYYCQRLRSIFTLTTVTSFPKLESLILRKCDKWEEIFCEESLKSIHASSSSIVCCFPKLDEIEISRCHRVRRLFSYPLAASHCPSLKKISIDYCWQFEGVVQAYEGEVTTHHHENNGKLFPTLNHLILRGLPKLREIYTGYKFSRLYHKLQIEDCPNICNIPLEDKAPSSSSVGNQQPVSERAQELKADILNSN